MNQIELYGAFKKPPVCFICQDTRWLPLERSVIMAIECYEVTVRLICMNCRASYRVTFIPRGED